MSPDKSKSDDKSTGHKTGSPMKPGDKSHAGSQHKADDKKHTPAASTKK